jgi:hypothetical protein
MVKRLGLRTTLKECKVPEKDIPPTIASTAKYIPQDEAHYDEVCQMLATI